MSEFSNTWNYHRDFNILHFGNVDQVNAELPVENDAKAEVVETAKPKKKRYFNQPKGWFRK